VTFFYYVGSSLLAVNANCGVLSNELNSVVGEIDCFKFAFYVVFVSKLF
jgi:hypothetical protein